MAAKKNPLDELRKEVYISEAYLTGLFWNNPSLYTIYSKDRIDSDSFMNKIWSFYFGFGRYMAERKVVKFDDITVYKFVEELNLQDKMEEYGGYNTIQEIMEEVEDKQDNFDAYYEEVKKYQTIRRLAELFGNKVIEPNGKYDYHDLSAEMIHTYWQDKVNQAGMVEGKFETKYLLKDLREKIQEWNENPDIGLDFYESKRLTEITLGWAAGTVYMFGSFSGRGKTSFTVNKVIMSCIANKEKLQIIANEQDADEWQKMLLITAMGMMEAKFKRKRLNEGDFTAEELDYLNKAIIWLEGMTQGDDSLISMVFLEKFTIDEVKKAIVHNAHRGYRSVIIDTAKPTEDRGRMDRWERFTEDMKEIYKLTKKDGGGLNLRMWVNVQLADAALTQRFLTEMALGESRKIKNEVGVLWMGRPIWEDEYEDGKNALTVWRWVKNDDDLNDDAKPYKKEEFTLPRFDKRGNVINYFLLFTGKNRRGQTNETGLGVLVFRVDFNKNTWKEVGFTTVAKDYAH